jgi:glycosyltransferase involved in cell wall biosynthesis
MINLGVLLPHTRLYGGVKRFIELGRHFQDMGHQFTVYSPQGDSPDWIRTAIRMASFAALENDHNDMLFFTDRKQKDMMLKSHAKYKVFYHVSRRHKARKIVKDGRFHVFACSTNIYRYDKFWFGVKPFLAAGGIDSTLLYPRKTMEKKDGGPFNILVYGRITEHHKGTELVVKACERLYDKYPFIKLLLFDTPVNQAMRDAINGFSTTVPYEFILNHPVEKNAELYHRADIFVAAEKQTGWANTVAEAMASGIPVVATRSGTLDIIIDHETGIFARRNIRSLCRAMEKLINSPELRQKLSANARSHIEKYDWRILAERIIDWYKKQEALNNL